MLSAHPRQHQTFRYAAPFFLIVRKKRKKVKWVICFFDWFPHPKSQSLSFCPAFISIINYILFSKNTVCAPTPEGCVSHTVSYFLQVAEQIGFALDSQTPLWSMQTTMFWNRILAKTRVLLYNQIRRWPDTMFRLPSKECINKVIASYCGGGMLFLFMLIYVAQCCKNY